MWRIPESELAVLGDVAGLDVLELGCGAAQWSVALAGRGARVTGLDLSEEQLRQAREAAAAAGVEVAFVHASAERRAAARRVLRRRLLRPRRDRLGRPARR